MVIKLIHLQYTNSQGDDENVLNGAEHYITPISNTLENKTKTQATPFCGGKAHMQGSRSRLEDSGSHTASSCPGSLDW